MEKRKRRKRKQSRPHWRLCLGLQTTPHSTFSYWELCPPRLVCIPSSGQQGLGSTIQWFLHPLQFPPLLTLISPPPPRKYPSNPTNTLPTTTLSSRSGSTPASSPLLQQDTAGHWPVLQAAPFFSPILLPPSFLVLLFSGHLGSVPTAFLSKTQSLSSSPFSSQ